MAKLIVVGVIACCLGAGATAMLTMKGFGAFIQMNVESDIDFAVAVRAHLEVGNTGHAMHLLAMKADCGRIDLESRIDNWYFEETGYTRKVLDMAAPFKGACSEAGTDGRP